MTLFIFVKSTDFRIFFSPDCIPNPNGGLGSAIVILFSASAMAARGTFCKGTVIDVYGEPVIGATVKIDTETIGAITDFDGNFTVPCESGQTLVISYVGYTAQQYCVGNTSTSINITLCEDYDNSARCRGTACSTTGGSTGGGECTTLPCNACTTTEWSEFYTGYETRKTGGTCSGNTCTSNGTCSGQTSEYRCADGYVGTPIMKLDGSLYTDTQGRPSGCAKIPSCSGTTCCGVVLDGSDNGLIPGATILIKPGTNGAATDLDGVFSVGGCRAGMKMYVYYLGYIRQVITLNTDNMYGNIIYLDEDPGDGVPCDDGYYTDWDTGQSRCLMCPMDGKITALRPQISGNWYNEITDCYIPKNTSYSDPAGTYEYTSDCYYKQ